MKVIAEIGVNHDGSIEKAMQLVDACKRLGADYAKFQIFDSSKITTAKANRAAYQSDALGPGSQQDMLRALELSHSDFVKLRQYCDKVGIAFLATPFDEDSAAFLVDTLGCRTVKVGSGDMDNLPLLMTIASKGADMVVSTGMADLDEINLSIDAIAYGRQVFERGEKLYANGFPSRQDLADASKALGRERIAGFLTLLHCTSEYPAVHPTLNMTALRTMQQAFGPIPIGFSDHSTDDVAAIMAIALGATVLERHITYDRNAKGPDHAASLDEQQFANMMANVRAALQAMGRGDKTPSSGEKTMRGIARKRILAARPIEAGSIITLADVAFKRSSEGRPASDILDVVGKPASRRADKDDPVVVD